MANIKLNILLPAKIAIYLLFLNYYCFSVLRGSLIPYCSKICYGICAICFLSDLITFYRGKLSLTKEEICWLAYAIISLALFPLAVSPSDALSGLFSYFQRLFLTILIIYICKRENSIQFPLTLLTVVCALCSIAILPNLANTRSRIMLESGYGISVNDVGSLMVYGAFAALFFLEGSKLPYSWKSAIKVGLVLLFCIVLFVSGSRKSFYAMILFFVLMFLFGRDRSRVIKLTNVVIIIILAVVTYYIVNKYLVATMHETSLYDRLFGDREVVATASDSGRFVLIQNAIEDFLNNPFIGLGFANYAVVHGTYSHCTFVEPLACSGLIGFLYLIPYVTIAKDQINLIKCTVSNSNLWQRQLFIFFIAFLFIGVGIPYMYKDLPCICLALFIASQSISREES